MTFPDDSPILKAFPPIPRAADNPLIGAATDHSAKVPTPLGGPVLTVQQATLLRTASVFACDRLAQFAREGGMDGQHGSEWVKREVTATGVDGFVWAGGKAKPEWRKLERFVCDSIFY